MTGYRMHFTQPGRLFFNHKRNEENPEEMKVEPLEKKVRRYKSNCVDKQQE
jgi:hypothetical protein